MKLPTAPAQRLGLPTIMDRALALEHGVPYVHLVAFAIDVDRVREATESQRDERPFGWEVFLTECYLLEAIDPGASGSEKLLEDTLLSVFELPEGQEVLGTQLPFAVWHLTARGRWPGSLARALRHWKGQPDDLGAELDGMMAEHDGVRATLSEGCLSIALDPPLAPPTRETLERWTTDRGAGRTEGG